MFWVFTLLFLAVVGMKYYTAVGSRNLERRLNRVKRALEEARQRLRTERQRQTEIAEDEEQAELQVRYMKELMMDMQVRLSQSDSQGPRKADTREKIASVMMQF